MVTKKEFRSAAIVLMLAAVALGSGILLARTQTKPQANSISSKLDRDNLPVIDYSLKGTESPSRLAKNKRFNGHNGFVEPEYHGADAVLMNDWNLYLPALPVAQSNLVVLGRVGRASAHLSVDKSTVYSEFTFTIEQILKNDADSFTVLGQELTVDRLGGRVRLPVGETLYRISGQGFPKANHTYVLFLRRKESSDYSILTGYEIQGKRVIPLDGSTVENNGKWVFDQYKDVDESVLLTQIYQLTAQK